MPITPTTPEGSGTFDPYDFPPSYQGIQTGVFRYSPGRGYSPLASVRWVDITYSKGPVPPRCILRYAFPADRDQTVAPPWAEYVLPLVPAGTEPAGSDVLLQDDRIVVLALSALGELAVLFDGFVQAPEGHVAGDSYSLPIQALSVACRCWDKPVTGSFMRPTSAIDRPDWSIYCHRPARFNPNGEGNCLGGPSAGSRDWWVQDPKIGAACPVFVDMLYPADGAGVWPKTWRKQWTLAEAARYIMYVGNDKAEWIELPDFEELEKLLGNAVIGTTGAITYEPILAPDLSCSEKPWPEALWNLIGPRGFSFMFRTYADAGGVPKTRLEIYRERDSLSSNLIDVYLQEPGATLVPGFSQVAQFDLARDSSQVVNSWSVRLKPDEVEAGFVLSPGFIIEDDDALAANLPKWKTAGVDGQGSEDPDRYRLFVYDESGEGHWDLSRWAWSKNDPGLIYPVLDLEAGYNHVVRRRVPHSRLISPSEDERDARKATLFLLTDYTGEPGRPYRPGAGGTAQQIKGGWSLLQDRIGVRLTCADPNAFSIGDHANSGKKRGGVIPIVEWYHDPSRVSNISRLPLFLLVCTIDADHSRRVVANRRSSSPTTFEVWRRVDAAERFKRQVVHESSPYYGSVTPMPSDPPGFASRRNDTEAARAYAEQIRAATDAADFAGSITFPRLVNTFLIGDRVRSIYPRMSLACSLTPEPGAEARFPAIVSFSWHSDGDSQTTTLHLDDRRAEGDPTGL